MTAFPYRCGRLDAHDPHEWQSRPLGANYPQRRYSCSGAVIVEGGHWDAVDDAAEERMDRERREVAA